MSKLAQPNPMYTPPPRVGRGTVLQFFCRDVRREHFIILCHIPDNSYTPFVVANWYPHMGDHEWHQGSYYENIINAVADFASRMPQ